MWVIRKQSLLMKGRKYGSSRVVLNVRQYSLEFVDFLRLINAYPQAAKPTDEREQV